MTISIDGVSLGNAYNVTSAGIEARLAVAIPANALTTAKNISVVVSNASSPVGLKVSLAVVVLPT